MLFDTFSAQHIPFQGYTRATTPNLAAIADQAVVYHNHYAAGSWTYPATASMLTGTYPWTNKALRRIDRIISPYLENNLFTLFQDHYRIAYTHNPIAERVLDQLQSAFDHYQSRQSLFIQDQFVLYDLFSDDIEIASLGLDRALIKEE
ncbi:MAG: sulfatase-like hydrolase/transferase, partial [Anaerolineae bacterium]|nr:sulfatase-like hydrolase/transferase [Anaerolineae bacterium]